ncbi:hypothetical protein M9434_001283 [Picochlorum sp. BPE23]|nr:hypothetical protein M9434_001283 [Picochlorum sp. BPE23]
MPRCTNCGRQREKNKTRFYQGRRVCHQCMSSLLRSEGWALSPSLAGRANKGGKQSGDNGDHGGDENSKDRVPSIADGADGDTSSEGVTLDSVELPPSMWDGGRAIQWLEAYKRELTIQQQENQQYEML